jgi:acyl-CoA hydrolase
MKSCTLNDWSQFIKNGSRIFIGSGAACPHTLVSQLLQQVNQFHGLEIIHILTLGETPWSDAKYKDNLKINSFFLGPGSRDAVTRGEADYTPCFLSEIPRLFDEGIVLPDVALIQVSPPDQHGYCSLGVSVDVVAAACRNARYVIAEVNDKMPRTLGQSFIHSSKISAYIETSEEIIEHPRPVLDDITLQIGRHVSLLIEDASTLQMGIGKIPDAVLHYLGDRKDLGIHTEMFSDGLLELYKKGAITNKYKKINPGKTITSFCFGTRELYDFVDNNPHVEFHPSEYVNLPVNIASNDKMISINSAIEIDLTGQVVADSIGHRFYSGIGGQVDFIRGAGMSLGGKPIIALPSTAAGGKVSRIVPRLSEGSGVVTSRGDVHYVVTEYGIATLRGRSIRERALELIQVAHPDFRDALMEEVREHFWVPNYQQACPVTVPELGNVEVKQFEVDSRQYYLRPLKPSDQRRLQ